MVVASYTKTSNTDSSNLPADFAKNLFNVFQSNAYIDCARSGHVRRNTQYEFYGLVSLECPLCKERFTTTEKTA